MSYSIEVHRTHVLVRGPLPLSHFAAVNKLAPRNAVVDPDLAIRMGADQCFVAPDAQHELRRNAPARPLPRGADSLSLSEGARNWLASGEHGQSSIAMFVAVTGLKHLLYDDRPQTRIAHPRDADDLRRCLALYGTVPEVRDAMDKVAALSLPWRAIIAHWDELTGLLPENPYAVNDALRAHASVRNHP